MKKIFLYISIALLYLLTTLCVLRSIGKMVSLKYEVDEKYWRIDGADNLTAEEKKNEINKLDNKGRRLRTEAYTFSLFALTTFTAATVLIIRRKRYFEQRKRG